MYQAGAANKATVKTESQNLHLTVSTLQKLSVSHCSVHISILPSLFSKSKRHCAFKSLNPSDFLLSKPGPGLKYSNRGLRFSKLGLKFKLRFKELMCTWLATHFDIRNYVIVFFG